MHLINVHGEEVEILRRDDEVYPHIPQIESLLGGIATEMGVCCSLFRPGTPALPSIGFQVDPRPSAALYRHVLAHRQGIRSRFGADLDLGWYVWAYGC